MAKADDAADSVRRTCEAVERGTLDPELLAEFERTIRGHRSKIFSVCYRVVRDAQRAEELTQDTLLVALSKLGSFRGASTLSTWLCGIATNLAFNAVRKKGELLLEDGILGGVEPEDRDTVTALRSLSRQERAHVLKSAAAECLNPREQDILYMRCVENLPYETIDALLGLAPDEGRVALQRSKRRLKPELLRRASALGHGPSFFLRTTGNWR